MDPQIFIELSIILVITVIVTGIVRALRQPAIIGYIFSGIIAGPSILNIIRSTDTLAAFSQIGIALLLFLVGLNLNPKVIKDVGKIALITGVGQVLFTSSIGFLIGKALGFTTVASLYIAIGMAFSSTIIIMKLLSDKRDLDSLYGRISVGFLIVQDFIAIIILLTISSLNTGSSINITTMAVTTMVKAALSIGLLFIITIYILPKVTKIIARSQEFLLLFSLTWCFAIASLFHHINFSLEAGALLAGISLSMSPYHFEISAKMKSLRDFFIILFFIVLGSEMIFSNVIEQIVPILLFSGFVLIGNPLIVMTLMGFFGYTKRNSFLAGLTVAQVSEFSLIVIAMGITVGHIGNEILSFATTVALITFAGSTYMIMYSHKIYPVISRYLSIFERKGQKKDEHVNYTEESHEIVLFGYNRIGYDILNSLKKIKKKFLVIDYDPKVIEDLTRKGYECRYGDANDLELLNEINFSKTKMVISTIPVVDTNLLIIGRLKETDKGIVFAAVSHQIDDAITLYEYGASYVIMPHFLGGKHFSTMIERNENLNAQEFLHEKISHLSHIKKRKREGHDHPIHEQK